MSSKFIVHQHKAGRSHFDLRIIQDGGLRSWSLLREPPRRKGESRLAIERETFPVESINNKSFEEEAFGRGGVFSWDAGDAEFEIVSKTRLVVKFSGNKISGKYEFRRMRWYPGNRWMFTKLDHGTTEQKVKY
jgi:bifunctional non-homologous end joining protein LigD